MGRGWQMHALVFAWAWSMTVAVGALWRSLL